MHKTFTEAVAVAWDMLVQKQMLPSWLEQRMEKGPLGLLVLIMGILFPKMKGWSVKIPIPNQELFENMLPPEVVALIKEREDIYICGGSVVRSLFGVYTEQDLDIFCLSQEAFDLVQQAMENARPTHLPEEYYYPNQRKYFPHQASLARVFYKCTQEAWESKAAYQSQLMLEDAYIQLAELVNESTERTESEDADLCQEYIEVCKAATEWAERNSCRLSYKVDVINRSKEFCGNPGTNNIQALLQSFDLNCCQVGTNLRKVVYTEEFSKFLLTGGLAGTATQTRFDKYVEALNPQSCWVEVTDKAEIY